MVRIDPKLLKALIKASEVKYGPRTIKVIVEEAVRARIDALKGP